MGRDEACKDLPQSSAFNQFARPRPIDIFVAIYRHFLACCAELNSCFALWTVEAVSQRWSDASKIQTPLAPPRSRARVKNVPRQHKTACE
jgi:hypothetical protein